MVLDLQTRARLPPGAAVGVTETMRRTLVEAFYGCIRADLVLGPTCGGPICGGPTCGGMT